MNVSQTYNKSESWLRPWNFITEDRRTFEVVRSVNDNDNDNNNNNNDNNNNNNNNNNFIQIKKNMYKFTEIFEELSTIQL